MIIFNIKLIMFTKSQSCDRCVRQGSGYLTNTATSTKANKKPESYLAKKFQQLYSEDKKLRVKKQSKIEEMEKKKQEKEVQGCTFKPEINTNPEYHINNDPFLKREMDWKRAIDKKIAQKREQISKKQKDDHTFQPKILESSPLITSQIKQTKSLASNYSTKSPLIEKKTYKVLHNERKKFKQIAKATIVEPFKHRRLHSTADSNYDQKLESSLHSFENGHKDEDTVEVSEGKLGAQVLAEKIQIQNQKEQQQEKPKEEVQNHNNQLKQLQFQQHQPQSQSPQLHAQPQNQQQDQVQQQHF